MIEKFLKNWKKRLIKKHSAGIQRGRSSRIAYKRMLWKKKLSEECPKETRSVPFYLDERCNWLNFYVKKKHFDGFYFEYPLYDDMNELAYIFRLYKGYSKSKIRKGIFRCLEKSVYKLDRIFKSFWLWRNNMMSAIEIPEIRKEGIKYEEAPRKRAGKLKRLWYKITFTAYNDDYHKEQKMQD